MEETRAFHVLPFLLLPLPRDYVRVARQPLAALFWGYSALSKRIPVLTEISSRSSTTGGSTRLLLDVVTCSACRSGSLGISGLLRRRWTSIFECFAPPSPHPVLALMLIAIAGSATGNRTRVLSTAKTDERGAFFVPDVKPGHYDFKTTKNGFESVVGRVIVSKAAPRRARIRVQLGLGT